MTLHKKLVGPTFLAFGALFGFLLSRAGATTYDFYAQLFLFQDFQLLWVIAVAAGLGALVHTVVRSGKSGKPKAILTAKALSYTGKPYVKSLVPGSLIFGIGWGLAGACPGTALAMLGEGKLASLWTLGGFVVGTLLYGINENFKLKKVVHA